MKRTLMSLSLASLLIVSGLGVARAQEEPKPKKDTVNQDTYAKPTFYYSTEDEKAKTAAKGSPATVIAIVCGVVVVAAGVTFFLLKKKKS